MKKIILMLILVIAVIKEISPTKWIWSYSQGVMTATSTHTFPTRGKAKRSLKRHLKKMKIKDYEIK